MIVIDGSAGEGGGQILRSALALSMLTGKPFRIEKIRANRAKPGLMRQHLTAVTAAARVCGGSARDAAIGSRQLEFYPGPVQAGDYAFSIGSAGSTTLVLQTVLPPLLLAVGISSIVVEGGTHNPHAPPIDFLAAAFVPILNRMDAGVEVTLERAGFYPAGGGRVRARVTPVRSLTPIHLLERGCVTFRSATALISGLPVDIAKRELAAARTRLSWPADSMHLRQLPDNEGPGNVFTVAVGGEGVTEVFTGFGERGVSAETVAIGAAEQALQYIAADVAVGECLADQLILPFAMAGGGSFITLTPTQHTRTNIEVVRMFLDVAIDLMKVDDRRWRIAFGGSG